MIKNSVNRDVFNYVSFGEAFNFVKLLNCDQGQRFVAKGIEECLPY